MATIDVLLDQIPDQQLRSRLAEQVKALTDRKQFGLVFQDHTPESIEVPGIRPRSGDTVRLRGDRDQVNLAVLKLTGGIATLATVLDGGAVSAATIDMPIEQLVVVKDFGDPIYAGLKSLGHIAQGGDKPSHLVIQGENYYALETLMYTHEAKVDVIYIDPPYNTGNKSWVYNDRYVAEKDAYKHSMWLAFMQRRLEHAKRLLKPTGVIIMAIDDNEHARLKLLADQVFGEQNFIANVVWQGGTNSYARYISIAHDYMLVYGKSAEALSSSGAKWREQKPGVETALAQAEKVWAASEGDHISATKLWRTWMRDFKRTGSATDAVTRYTSLSQDGRPIRTDGNMVAPEARPNRSRRPLIHPSTFKPCAVPANGWRYSDDEMDRRISAGLVAFGPDESTTPSGISFLEEMDERVADGVFEQSRTRSSAHLANILGSKEFPFPKDVDVIARWVNIVSGNNPDAVVLDFFAGTGTTAEAVMRLNQQDGGRRQSIVVTNNELASKTADKLSKAGFLPGDPEWESEGIYNKVTRPRIETVVTGIRTDGTVFSDAPLAENVEFFELTYEDANLIQLGRKFQAISPLLWAKAGAVGSRVDSVDTEAGWSLPDDAVYGVLFDEAKWAPFVDAINAASDRVHQVFIVTDSESAFQTIVARLPEEGARFSTTRLYSDYLHAFEINGKD